MKRLLPVAVVLVGLWAFFVLFRLSSAYEKPSTTPPPLPTAKEIRDRALGFKYEIGKQGGTLNDWIQTELKDLNLAISTDATTSSVLSGLVFEGLLTREAIDLEWGPMLALEVPLKSEDPEGLVYLVRLRQDVLWHDGERFTADDVVFTFNEIVLNEAIPCGARSILQMEVPDETGKTVRRNVLVEKVDDFTVRFTLPKRYALYTQILAATNIYPKHVLKPRVDDGSFNSTWNVATPPSQVIGTGPFMPQEYVSGERFTEVRNPRYWQKDEAGNRLPYIDKIVYNIVQKPENLKSRFLVGELDYLSVQAIDLAEIVKKQPTSNYDVVIGAPQAGWMFLTLNQNPRKRPDGRPYVAPWKSGWFRDVRFRRAVASCIDKESIRELVFDGIALSNFIPYTPKFSKYYTSDVRIYPFDIPEANRLLDEMGLTARNSNGIRQDSEGHPVEFVVTLPANLSIYVNMVTIMAQDLQKAGVRLIPEFVDFNLLVRKINTDWDWEGAMLAYQAGPEPLTAKILWKSSEARRIWNPRVQPGSGENRDWEKRLDEIFEEAYSSWDDKAQRFRTERDVELAHEWLRIAAENLPHIYTMSRIDLYAVSRRIRNRNTTAHQLFDPRRIWLEK